MYYACYGNMGCKVFKSGIQNQINFLPKINIIKGNVCQKTQCQFIKKCKSLTFKVNFLFQNWSVSFWFSFRKQYVGAYFWTTSNLKINYFLKWRQIIEDSTLSIFKKYNDFLGVWQKIYLPFARTACIFFTPFFTAVYNQERLIL